MNLGMDIFNLGLPSDTSGKEPICQCRRHKRHRFDPWVRKIPWKRAWQPTPVLLPGESQGHRSLLGYSAQYHKESDTTDETQHTYIFNLILLGVLQDSQMYQLILTIKFETFFCPILLQIQCKFLSYALLFLRAHYTHIGMLLVSQYFLLFLSST